MYKTIFGIIFICSLLIGCDVRKNDKQGVQQEIKDPTTVQVIDSVFDFGKINEGEAVEFRYRFKNTGTRPLVVSDAHASCGCTVPEKPEKPIMPGETGYIKVKFNSDKRPGEANKAVTVSSNANPPFPQLLLKGTVIGKQ